MIKLKKNKSSCVTAVILSMCLMTAGCARNSTTDSTNNENAISSGITQDESNIVHAADAENSRVDITGEFTITTQISDGVTQSGSIYTITKAGEYTVSGLLSEGQIIVDAPEDAQVTIILNGVSVTCSKDSPVYVKNADEVKIKSNENTFNEVKDSRAEATEDSSDDLGNAAIYADCDLSLTGKGTLVVTGNYNNGIQSKDDLSIKNVTLKVTAANNALKGNDAVEIESGEIIAISSKGDGIKTSNSSLSSKGNQKGIVTITGGNIDIYAACDGIDSAYGVDVSGDGNLNIYTDTYSDYSKEITASSSGNAATQSIGTASTVSYTISNAPGNMGSVPDNGNMNGGNSAYGTKGNKMERPGMPGDFNESGNSSGKSYSTKGIKAESEITISGCTINISSTDDGIHADKKLDVNGGYINVVTCVEGLEAMTININDGKTFIYATDDGINACTGDRSSTPLVNIAGGYVDVTTSTGDTDGIDSNGNYTQSGGFVIVKGSNASGNMAGSIDVDGNVTITGGTAVALGGICETPANSVNGYVLSSVSFSQGSYSLKDSSGNEILSFTLNASYSNGWICSSDLKTGSEYTLSLDGSPVANWTQESGTMGASGAGGFGGMGGKYNNGGFGGRMQ